MKQEAVNITGANVSMVEDRRARERRYLLSMLLRTVCFVGAILASGWLRWTLVAGAIVLPYIAVVMANARASRRQKAAPVLILRNQREVGGTHVDT